MGKLKDMAGIYFLLEINVMRLANICYFQNKWKVFAAVRYDSIVSSNLLQELDLARYRKVRGLFFGRRRKNNNMLRCAMTVAAVWITMVALSKKIQILGKGTLTRIAQALRVFLGRSCYRDIAKGHEDEGARRRLHPVSAIGFCQQHR